MCNRLTALTHVTPPARCLHCLIYTRNTQHADTATGWTVTIQLDDLLHVGKKAEEKDCSDSKRLHELQLVSINLLATASTINFHILSHSLAFTWSKHHIHCTTARGIYRISIQHRFLYFVYYSVTTYTNVYSSPPPPLQRTHVQDSLCVIRISSIIQNWKEVNFTNISPSADHNIQVYIVVVWPARRHSY